MMRTMKRLMVGVGLVALSAGVAAAAPAVVRSPVNMRDGPGTQYAVIQTLPGGATVDVAGCSGSWCQVAYGGEQGYASRAYLGLGTAAVEPGYGYEEGYYEPDYSYGPDYYGDYAYYGDYGYPYGGFAFGFGGGRHFRDHDHDRFRGDRGTRMGRFSGNNTNFASRNFTPQSGRPPQGRANFQAAPNTRTSQSFGPGPSHMGGTTGAGAPMARGTVGAGAPMGGPRGGGGGGFAGGHFGGGGGGGHMGGGGGGGHMGGGGGGGHMGGGGGGRH